MKRNSTISRALANMDWDSTFLIISVTLFPLYPEINWSSSTSTQEFCRKTFQESEQISLRKSCSKNIPPRCERSFWNNLGVTWNLISMAPCLGYHYARQNSQKCHSCQTSATLLVTFRICWKSLRTTQLRCCSFSNMLKKLQFMK